jgi:putrescine transport system ATP-binding protein
MVTADRIAVMAKGQIAQVGPPAEVYDAPASRYVAEFLGEVNLFEGRVAADSEGSTLTGPEATLKGPASTEVTSGAQAWLAVRPEKIAISAKAPARADNRIPGAVREIAFLGAATAYRVETASGRIVRVTQANSRPGAETLALGQSVWLSFPRAAGVVLAR